MFQERPRPQLASNQLWEIETTKRGWSTAKEGTKMGTHRHPHLRGR